MTNLPEATRQTSRRQPRARRDLRPARLRLGVRVLALIGWTLAGGGVLPPSFGATAAEEATVEVHVTFSSRLFTGVNESDAKASVRAWAEGWSRESYPYIALIPHIAKAGSVIDIAGLRSRSEFVVLTTDEYLLGDQGIEVPSILVSTAGVELEDRYILVVQTDSQIHSPEDLRGRSLNLFKNAHTSLAPYWLDTVLLDGDLPPAETYFGILSYETKLTSAVLPVFFGQVDACLVTRHALDTMIELNPQLAHQTRVLMESPGFVPVVCFFGPAFDPRVRRDISSALTGLKDSTFGSQILTLFQADGVVEVPSSRLDSARELLARHASLLELYLSRPEQGRGATSLAGDN